MRVYLHTFGCKANQTDTERVRQALEDRGARVVDHPADADVAVVNSCTVTHVGESKMRRFVRRVAREQPEIDTVVIGCAAAVDDGSIAALPSVRHVIAGGDPEAVLRAVGLPDQDVDPVLRRYADGWQVPGAPAS